MSDTLDLYELGVPGAIHAIATVAHLGGVQAMLEREGTAWIAAHGPAEVERRRLVAATFALEAAHSAVETNAMLGADWMAAAALIDWGCAQLRRQPMPLPAELIWQRAALALAEGAGGLGSVRAHLAHAKSRFPDEPRWIVTDAWLKHFDDPSLSALLKAPSLEGEGLIRLGYNALRAGHLDAALAHLEQGRARTKDVDMMYLSYLFSGRAHVQTGQIDLASDDFRAAMRARPGAFSAILEMSIRLYSTEDGDHRDEAASLIDEALVSHPAVADPWRLYGLGDFRFYPDLIAQLRESIR